MFDAPIHAFQVDLTEQSSRDRINLAKDALRDLLKKHKLPVPPNR